MPEEPGTSSTAPKRDDFLERILDSVVDLLETARDWVRQEAEATVREKIVLPLQRLGLTLASAAAAAVLLVIALIFIAVAAVIALGNVIGYAWTFFAIGMSFLIGSTIFLAIKVRSMQK
jgi:hypothetical protein